MRFPRLGLALNYGTGIFSSAKPAQYVFSFSMTGRLRKLVQFVMELSVWPVIGSRNIILQSLLMATGCRSFRLKPSCRSFPGIKKLRQDFFPEKRARRLPTRKKLFMSLKNQYSPDPGSREYWFFKRSEEHTSELQSH